MKLTSKTVENIKPTAARREIPDSVMPGHYLVVQPSGVKSWAVRYRHHGQSRKLTLGGYPVFNLGQAREAAGKALRMVAEGRDPGRERQEARADTIEAVTEQFMDRHSRRHNRASTVAANERMIRDYIRPAWAGRAVRDVRKRDIISLLEDVAKERPIAANRVAALLSKLFSWCVQVDILAASPMAGVQRPSKEKSRERVLSDVELAAVWRGADKLGGPFGAATKLLILTGQRRDEVLRMTWDEVDLVGRVWSLSGERVKNGRAHAVPLSDQAVEILRGMPQSSGPVFAGAQSHSRGKQLLDEATGPVAAWRLHDIRRSVSTGLAKGGVPLQVTERILNHRSGSVSGIAAVYNRHDYQGEMRQALEAWARHVEIVGKAGQE